MQKLHMPLILAQNIDNNLLFGVADNIVILAAVLQKHFGAVIFFLLAGRGQIAGLAERKHGLDAFNQAHFIHKIHFFAVQDF